MSTPRIPRRKPLAARVGVFGVGFHAYWPQFDGMLEELLAKQAVLVERLKGYGVEVADFGMVDDAESAYALLPRLKAADLDLVFCDMVTYATSASFGAIARGLDVPSCWWPSSRCPDWTLTGRSTYMQLCNDDFCSVPSSRGWPSAWPQGSAGRPGPTARRSRGRRRTAGVVQHRQGPSRPDAGPHRPFRPSDRTHARHADRPGGIDRNVRLPHRADRGRRSFASGADRDAAGDRGEEARNPRFVRHARSGF